MSSLIQMSIYTCILAKIGGDTEETERCKVCPLSVYRSPRYGLEARLAPRAGRGAERPSRLCGLDRGGAQEGGFYCIGDVLPVQEGINVTFGMSSVYLGFSKVFIIFETSGFIVTSY